MISSALVSLVVGLASTIDSEQLVVVSDVPADLAQIRRQMSTAKTPEAARSVAEDYGFELFEARDGIHVASRIASAERLSALSELLPASFQGKPATFGDLDPRVQDYVRHQFRAWGRQDSFAMSTVVGAEATMRVALRTADRVVEVTVAISANEELSAGLRNSRLLPSSSAEEREVVPDGNVLQFMFQPDLSASERGRLTAVATEVYLAKLQAIGEREAALLEGILPSFWKDLARESSGTTMFQDLPQRVQARVLDSLPNAFPAYGFASLQEAQDFVVSASVDGFPITISLVVGVEPSSNNSATVLGVGILRSR